MRTLKKQRNESVKNYEVLQNRCGCGSCGCPCSSGCADGTDAQVYVANDGNAEAGYRINLGAHS